MTNERLFLKQMIKYPDNLKVLTMLNTLLTSGLISVHALPMG